MTLITLGIAALPGSRRDQPLRDVFAPILELDFPAQWGHTVNTT
jgi:hypothetical protein